MPMKLLAIASAITLLACGSDRGPVPAPVEGQSPLFSSPEAPAATRTQAAPTAPPPAASAEEAARSLLPGVDLTPYFADRDGARALELFDAGKHAEAAKAFDALVAADPDGSRALAASYLAAVSKLYAGDNDDAARRFGILVNVYPLLADYHQTFRATALLGAGKAEAALDTARKVDAASANGERASLVAGRALLALSRPKEAASHMQAHVRRFGRDAASQLLLARALSKAGKTTDAATAFRLAQARFPLSREAGEAEKELASLAKRQPKRDRAALTELRTEELLLKGQKLFDAHRSEAAIKILGVVANRQKKGSLGRCTALELIARSWDKLRTRPKGHPTYVKYVAECSGAESYPLTLYLAGKSYYQSGKNSEAMDMFAKLHREHPEHSTNDDALVYEAHIWGERSKATKRRKALLRALSEYPDGDKRDDAAWLLLSDAYDTGDMSKTLKVAEEVQKLIPRESTYYSEGRTLYWKARALTKLKRTDEAKAAYREVLATYPMSYYAHLAFGRLTDLGGDEALRTFREVVAADPTPKGPLFTVTPDLLGKPELKKGVELIRMGLLSPAKRELSRLGKDARGWLLAFLYDRAGAFPLSHNIPRRSHPEFQQSYPKGTHALAWTIAYPRPFADLVQKSAKDAGIAPELAWAIMREESGFSPGIESWANAVGLMQILVPTGQTLIEKGETDKVSRETLKDPALNIRLGTRFLGRLTAKFGSPALAAAGYNAGGGAVQKWLGERGNLPLDEFVEAIPYRQTREYVKRVMSTLGAYRYLYEGTPQTLAQALK